jgi:TetR/AcrR family transcriptional regulator, tetracycline repressor protein
MSAAKRTSPSSSGELSRDRAVEVAIALAEEKDVQAVSIRQVAKRLGVTPMALYWHFKNKDDLLNAMVDWLYGQMDFALVDESASWQAQLRSIIDAEIAVLRAYPRTAMLILSRGSTAPHSLSQVELTLGILRQGGFSPGDASRVLTYLETIVSLVARESLLATPGEGDGDWQRQVQTTIQSLPPDQFPNILEAAEHLGSAPDPDAYYAFGVDLLMAGIEAMAGRSGAG